jgi:hypothetical protein
MNKSYYIYRATHPDEEGCYVGYVSNSCIKRAWGVARKNASGLNSNLAHVLEKHEPEEFELILLGIVELPKGYINSYMREVIKMHNASWNTDNNYCCVKCKKQFSKKMTYAVHIVDCNL